MPTTPSRHRTAAFIAGLFLTAATAWAFARPPAEFASEMDRAHMVFSMPDSVTEVPVFANGQMHFEYALRTADSLEIRYSIHPLDSEVLAYKAFLAHPKPGQKEVDPNKLYKVIFQTVLMNVSQEMGKFRPVKEFDSAAVTNEFHADWGAFTPITPKGKFGEGYRYCLALAIHKNDLADAYVFFLANDPNKFRHWLPTFFYCLRFQ